MNYFVEGLQGSGKSTLVNRLSEKNPYYKAICEGEYSPVELAWCAYVNKETYEEILKKYNDIRDEIKEKSFKEDDHMIICYTKILTDIVGFHKDLEQYEIYNGRQEFEAFKDIVFRRFRNWDGDRYIFECSIFQNIVEDMILYRNMSDQEIIDFYKELADITRDKDFRILYLKTENIAESIGVIRKERSDEHGNEMWFPLMTQYFDESPYSKSNGVSGVEELFKHFAHRQELELRICREIFGDKVTVLESKGYSDDEF